ncbi:uncharacterized protein LOC144119172 [Amblyomma americanum]
MSANEESVPSIKHLVNTETATASSGLRASERSGGLDEYLQQALSLDEEEVKQLLSMNEEGPRTPTNSMTAVVPGSEPSAEAPAAAQPPVLAPAARCGHQSQLLQTTGGPGATGAVRPTPAAIERQHSIFNTAPLSTGLVAVLLVGIIAAFAYAIIFRGGQVSGRIEKRSPGLANDTAGFSG